jgi:hypothetical protein
MSLFHSSKYKLKNIQRAIDSLLDGDFPLRAGEQALLKLRDVFSGFDANLDRAELLNDELNLRQVAQNLNVKIYQALPVLGFVLRSTNVRNAFEMLQPLHAIAKAALQGNPQLILSSEWDYVPFAYPQSLDNLKSFILIGLPASEAASALLMPLAGHELGHPVWRNRGIGAGLQESLQSKCRTHYSARMPEFRRTFIDYRKTISSAETSCPKQFPSRLTTRASRQKNFSVTYLRLPVSEQAISVRSLTFSRQARAHATPSIPPIRHALTSYEIVPVMNRVRCPISASLDLDRTEDAVTRDISLLSEWRRPRWRTLLTTCGALC